MTAELLCIVYAVWLVQLQHKVNQLLELVSWVGSEKLGKEAIVGITTSLTPHCWDHHLIDPLLPTDQNYYKLAS